MRVLITTDTFYPMINGVVISINNLYKELKSQGHDVKIMTLSHSNKENVEGDIYYLKSRKIRIYPDARIKTRIFSKLVKEIIDWKPDVIHSQTEFSTMITAKIIARRLDIPHIHTYHTLYEDYLKYILRGKVIRKGAAARLTRLLLNSLDAVIVPTEKVDKVLSSYGVDIPTYTVPTGIDLSKFNKKITFEEINTLKNELQIKESEKVLVYIGRIAEEKNIEEIMDYFSQLLEKQQNIKLMICGGGPYLEKLEKRVMDLNIEQNVIFTGMIPPDEVHKYYKIGDVFVTSSTSETQGLTYIEAMSSGCPVVCRKDECVNELITEAINGFTYKNSEGFVTGVLNIINDDSLRSKMKINTKSKAKEYSTEIFGDRIINIYEDEIKKKILEIAI